MRRFTSINSIAAGAPTAVHVLLSGGLRCLDNLYHGTCPRLLPGAAFRRNLKGVRCEMARGFTRRQTSLNNELQAGNDTVRD
jgi:hypothetical protein